MAKHLIQKMKCVLRLVLRLQGPIQQDAAVIVIKKISESNLVYLPFNARSNVKSYGQAAVNVVQKKTLQNTADLCLLSL